MSRTRLTLAVALTLTASYQLYAQWSDSFTRVVAQAKSLPREHSVDVPETFVEIAQQYLPDVAWLQNPGYTFQRDDELFVYAGSAEPIRDPAADSQDPHAADRINLTPFALIWIDPEQPERAPYVVQCDTARVQFLNPVEFSFNAPSPGRLKAVWLEGAVTITGPDGLQFQGEDFDFSEDSLNLYSPRAIRFAYGPSASSSTRVTGSAEGISVNFSANRDPDLGPELPLIGPIKKVRLMKSVVLDCEYDEREGEQTRPATAHISCDETLDLQVDDHEATAILLKNVLVRRPTGGTRRPHEADTLRCHQLDIRFIERPAVRRDGAREQATPPQAASSVNGVGNPFALLRVQKIDARSSQRGDRAILQSDAQRVSGRMQRLQFDIDSGVAVLSDAESVRIDRDGTQLLSPQITVSPATGAGQHVITCRGPGRLLHPDAQTGDPLLEATWASELRAAPDADTGLLLVQLDADVRLIVSEKQDFRAGLRADQLNLWIHDAEPAEGENQSQQTASLPGAQLSAAATTDALPLRYVEARGGVMVVSDTLIAETELLQAEVQPGVLPHPDEEQAKPVAGEQSASTGPDEPWRLASRKITLRLLNEPGKRPVQVAEAVADGEVLLSQTVAAEEAASATPDEISMSGAHLQLVNEGGAHQFVILSGAPALLRRGAFLLECRNLQLDRAGNKVAVVGEGLLQAPVDRDLSGAELADPVVLDVKWQAGMTFDGTLAEFRQRVSMQLRDSVLQCDEMDVRLDQAVSFTDQQTRAEQLAIRDVDCRNGVHVEIYDWKENRIVGIRKAQLTRFQLDYQSGGFYGDGPGKVSHWSYTDGRRAVAIASPKPAQANVGAATDGLDWEYINVEFDDLLRGNFKDRTAELNGRVRTIYAPVRRVSETFARNDLSGDSPSVEHAVRLDCDRMSIELPPDDITVEEGQEQSGMRMIVGADGRCELEGKLFHARADSMSYDETKQLFTLRGKGEQEAVVTYQEPGSKPRRAPGRIIQFIPSEKGQVRIENSSGIQGSL